MRDGSVCLSPLSPSTTNDFARQYRHSTRVSPDVALLRLSSPYVGCPDKINKHTIHIRKHIRTRSHISTFKNICIDIYFCIFQHALMILQGNNNIRNGIV